jgi:hypothetical protein
VARLTIVVTLLVLGAGCVPLIQTAGVVGQHCGTSGCPDPVIASEGTSSEDRPAPSSMHTDAETARIASIAHRAALRGDCERALDALDVIAARDSSYFAHLALDPTLDTCRP